MVFSSCHNGDKELSQGEKVFLQYIQYRTISIPQEGHSFILLSKQSCHGCQSIVYNLATKDTGNTTSYMIDVEVMENNGWYASDNMIVDTENIISKLNWDYNNVVEVYTSDGKIDSIKDYSSDELLIRYMN